jgi:hypothetical protein
VENVCHLVFYFLFLCKLYVFLTSPSLICVYPYGSVAIPISTAVQNTRHTGNVGRMQWLDFLICLVWFSASQRTYLVNSKYIETCYNCTFTFPGFVWKDWKKHRKTLAYPISTGYRRKISVRRNLRTCFFHLHGRCLTVTVAEGTVSELSAKLGTLHF